MEKKKASWSIYTYICWYKAVFSRLVCMALVSVQDTIVWAFAEPCVRDARLYCIYLYYFWKAVKWKWFVTMFHVNSNKGSCNRFRLVFLGCSHRWWGGWRVSWLFCVFKFISSIEHMPVSYKGILFPSHRKHCNMQYTSLLFFSFFLNSAAFCVKHPLARCRFISNSVCQLLPNLKVPSKRTPASQQGIFIRFSGSKSIFIAG